MSHPKMLYKKPGIHEIHGDLLDYLIVDYEDTLEYNNALKDGWSVTTPEAINKAAEAAALAAAPVVEKNVALPKE